MGDINAKVDINKLELLDVIAIILNKDVIELGSLYNHIQTLTRYVNLKTWVKIKFKYIQNKDRDMRFYHNLIIDRYK